MFSKKITCPICGSIENKFWGEKNEYIFYSCKNCTHIFTITENVNFSGLTPNDFRNIITNNLMGNDEQYYHHLKAGERPYEHTSITVNIILDYIKQNAIKGKNWLDIGCGSGYLLMKLKKESFKTIGIEPGGWGQIAARERNLNITQSFLNKSTFANKFYIISATDVLEHQRNPVEFLAILNYYMHQDGYIILSIPFVESFSGKFLKTKWNMVSPPTHSQFFTKRSLKYATDLLDLKIIDIIRFNSRRLPIIGKYKKIQSYYNYFVKNTLLSDQALIIIRKNRL